MMRLVVRVAPLAIGLAAVGYLCSRFGLRDVVAAVRQLTPRYAMPYLGVCMAVLFAFSLRWSVVARAVGARTPVTRLLAVRLAGDAAGALLPGGRIAGDPVRIALLYADGTNGVRAGAGVAIDRMMEVIGSSVCALAYVSIFLWTRTTGVAAGTASWLIIGAMVMALFALTVTIVMLRRGRRPFTPLVAGIVDRWLPRLRGWMEAARQTEDQLTIFLREHPVTFVGGLMGSFVIEGLVVLEYHLLLLAFGITVALPTLLMVLVTSGVGRAMPTPGGLGVVEAGEVAVLAVASGRPDVGFVIGMVMRLHEALWILVGLVVLSVSGTSLSRLRLLAARSAAV